MRLKLRSTLQLCLLIVFLMLVYIWLHQVMGTVFRKKPSDDIFDPKQYIFENGLQTFKDGYKKHGFNQLVSDNLPIDRKIPDTRHKKCLLSAYSYPIPRTSIIITFFNEARSVLLRTLQSVLRRTPSDLIEDIILIDDHSDNENDGKLLTFLSNKIKIIRNKKREGLIRSRILGVSRAQGEVLTFLDSHCEVNVGWIEPLLSSIAQNPYKVVSPVIDIINMDSFKYVAASSAMKGGFDWKMHFKWDMLTKSDLVKHRKYPTESIKTPMIAGGLFSIKKEWFIKLGMYDPLLDIWGGENFEISYKTWMCGGSMEIVPCSRVGHVFRKLHPYSFPKGNGVTYLSNVHRVAEVWMDSYKQLLHKARGVPKSNSFPGIGERKKLRSSLRCKSFSWYLKNVYPELRIPSGEEAAYGELRNGNDLCLAHLPSNSLSLQKCQQNDLNQYWTMTKSGLIRSNKTTCLKVTVTNEVYQTPCNNRDPNQHWRLMIRERIRHHVTNLCLEFTDSFKFILDKCKENFKYQKWKFSIRFFY